MSEPLPETSIRLVRVFAAPVEEVFQAFTEAELLMQWMAPTFCRVVEASCEPRAGGHYRVVVKTPLGGKTVTTGEYREVLTNRRIVQTWVLEQLNDKPVNYPTLLTVDFKSIGPASTEITLQQDQLLTRMDRMGNRGGWKQCFKKLDRVLTRGAVDTR